MSTLTGSTAASTDLRPRVLVVEDSEINRGLAMAWLAKAGCRADAVVTGLDAVEAARRTRYDLILMDCRLPDVQGVTVTRMIRSEQPSYRVPIIGITAFAPGELYDECLRAGMDACYEKPMNGGLLLHILERWLPSSNRPTATRLATTRIRTPAPDRPAL